MLAEKNQHSATEFAETQVQVTAAFNDLVRAQAELARLELKDAARRGGQLGVAGAAAGAAGAMTMLFAALAAAFALSIAIPVWAAFLVVAALFGGPATLFGVAALHAARRFRPVPPETLASLQEHVQWIRTRVHGS
ncbi:MAG: phage holin family protein [Acidimicrobiaceae bacterium]|nr:phage holin family protein [Acidimicrobiaceae bacterium]